MQGKIKFLLPIIIFTAIAISSLNAQARTYMQAETTDYHENGLLNIDEEISFGCNKQEDCIKDTKSKMSKIDRCYSPQNKKNCIIALAIAEKKPIYCGLDKARRSTFSVATPSYPYDCFQAVAEEFSDSTICDYITYDQTLKTQCKISSDASFANLVGSINKKGPIILAALIAIFLFVSIKFRIKFYLSGLLVGAVFGLGGAYTTFFFAPNLAFIFWLPVLPIAMMFDPLMRDFKSVAIIMTIINSLFYIAIFFLIQKRHYKLLATFIGLSIVSFLLIGFMFAAILST